MADLTVSLDGTPIPVFLGENVAIASAAAAAATAAAEVFAMSRKDDTLNLFDPGAVGSGQEVYSDGTLSPEANSNYSAFMPVRGARFVTISGLGINPGFARYVQWFDDAGAFISATTIADGLNAAFLEVPVTAWTMRFSPRQRYAAGSTDFGSVRVVASNAPWAGKAIEILGDSISEMSDVDNSKYLFEETYSGSTEYRVNWPYWAVPRVVPSRVRLRAKAGGHFADAAGLTSHQKFSTQVAEVIADTAPDAIIIGMGTNDWGNSTNAGGAVVLGTAAAALAKDFGSLDPTISMDGMRHGLHLLRYNFPEAVIFGLTPLQRGDFKPTTAFGGLTMTQWVEEIRTMYRAYGVEIIDQFTDLGILWAFEETAPGPHLNDQVHPLTAGMQLQAALITARYRARMGGTA